ncbi:MAG: serine/threonine protein kinase [Planctomycetes bacterium]|nr:serine/threonine protein kinase [Planctomycetota bacterium]
MNGGQTRFFCRCGRLLTVDASVRDVVCPTCRERSVVPHVGAPHPPPPPAPPPAAGGPAATAVLGARAEQRVGRFELKSVLGRGGMGTVWRARDVEKGGEVALKVLHPALQARPDFLSRFSREARAAAGLSHPNIVRVLDAGLDGGTPWIAMELVEGEDLLAAAQRGSLGPHNFLAVAEQATRGLLAAAEMGITHRDIKPGNLLLRPDGSVKVADFGLAKAVDSDSRLTVTGEILGTPHYMAPEQGRGERVDHRADLYSLGATFYHVLGGCPPHEADTPVAVILKHLREEPLPLRARNGKVTPGLERVVHRLLQKNPDQRYQSHAALLSDLERLRAGREPIGGADPPLRRVQQGATTYMLPHESTTELVLEPAGALRRFAAFVVDLLALELLLHVLLFAGRALAPEAAAPRGGVASFLVPTLPTAGSTAAIVLASAAVVAALLYFATADARGGRTVGKRWLNVRLCRRDGGDLGAGRALLRTLLVAPGLLLISPTLSACTQSLLALGSASAASPRLLIGAGAGWFVVLELLGRMSAFGRALQDGLSGAVTYAAQRAVTLVPPPAAASGERSPGRALRLSIIPGLGVMYAGHPLLGVAILALVLFLLIDAPDPRTGLGVWLISAFVARGLARRTTASSHPLAPTSGDPTPPLRTPIRRQES